jgi:hypothetical protein
MSSFDPLADLADNFSANYLTANQKPRKYSTSSMVGTHFMMVGTQK